MTVVDASVLVDALVVAGPAGEAARTALVDRETLHVPTIFPAEVTSAVRSLCARRELDPGRARGALAQLAVLRTVEYPFGPFLDRVWELRANVTVYDAWYVALAESLGCELITADARLARADGARCPIVELQQPEPGTE